MSVALITGANKGIGFETARLLHGQGHVVSANAVGIARVTEAAVEPGYTATDMTAGYEGGRSPQESAEVVVKWATLDGGPTGTFQDEAGAVAW